MSAARACPRSLSLVGLVLVASCASPGNPASDAFSWTTNDGVGFVEVGDSQGPATCDEDGDCPPDIPHCAVTGFCFECTSDAHCPDGRCNEGVCLPAACTPGEKRCAGNAAVTCVSSGDGWSKNDCIGSLCVEGECTGCVPGATACQGTTVATCLPDGSGYTPTQECEAYCAAGACSDCPLGEKRCTDSGLIEQCLPNGQWQVVEDCTAQGANCTAGFCISPCNPDPKFLSNSGCDYWAVDLDNHPEALDSPYALVVANLGEESTEVRILNKTDVDANSTLVDSDEVAPGALRVFMLPARNMAGTGIFFGSYRVQSDSPIVAYQFNPLDNVDVFSNDASLLIPANAFGKEYVVVSRFQFTGGGPEIPAGVSCSAICSQYDGGVCIIEGLDEICTYPYRGTVSVVAKEVKTTVQVTPTARTQLGGQLQTMLPGQTYSYSLEPFQVLNLRSDGEGEDLTGTIITSDKPVGVFSGHMAAITSTTCCADHLEQMLFPVSTWGKTYVATKSYARGVEPDYWRIVAAEDGTQVQFQPAVAPTQYLNRGQFFEFATTQDFRVTGDKPFMVAQILASSYEVPAEAPCTSSLECGADAFCSSSGQCFRYCSGANDAVCGDGATCTCSPSGELCYCAPIGDPAMILAAPLEQYRTDYVFLSPDKYLDDYINIIAPSTASATLDGQEVPGAIYTAIPGTGFKVARLKVGDGIHRVTATEPVGVIVYGYDRDVSYGYPAGLNLSDAAN